MPHHITWPLIPTSLYTLHCPHFAWVILADELLEQFFETFFPQSFRLADLPPNSSNLALSPSSNTLSGNLTTFSNLGTPVKNLLNGAGANKTLPDVGRAGGVVEPGSRGLRGVLDNIVNDGMRMAAEMRKRMDDAQRKNSSGMPGNKAKNRTETKKMTRRITTKRTRPSAVGMRNYSKVPKWLASARTQVFQVPRVA